MKRKVQILLVVFKVTKQSINHFFLTTVTELHNYISHDKYMHRNIPALLVFFV